jgi:ABC-2 type transport system ATP-binding protein
MIYVNNLVKRFGHINAVNDISFSLGKGEVLGLLGPNGAGKSTTMRIITGYLPASSGTVKFNDIDVVKSPEKVKEHIGYLPESTPVYKDMTVNGFLKFAASIRKLNNTKKAIERVIDLCNLQKVVYQSIDTLSKGYTQRVCLAQALIHDPQCLILDEPTDGLDPIQKKEIQELIKEMGKTKTILISTHMLDEVEDYCSRIIIISEGKIKAQGSLEEIKGLSSHSNTLILELPMAHSENVDRFVESSFKDKLKSLSKHERGGFVKYRFFPKSDEFRLEIMKNVFHFLEENQIQISDFKFDKGSLNSAFRTLAVSNKIKRVDK